MNKIYRLIWSKAKEKWVVVAEKVAAKGCCPAATVGALTLAALLAAGGAAFALDPGALPTGGKITTGSGTIATSGNQMTINQTTQQMITNWSSFNIGQNAGVQFKQPNSAATALNRIHDQNPSQILGSLSANGNVFLLNPAGIIFGQTARVDVGGLVASSLSMLDRDFLAGKYAFTNPGNAGTILNQGSINALPGGVVALIAPKVSNEGAITANGGNVVLAAGNQVSLDFKGDGLITYTVDQGAVDALVDNKGLIKADGGLVVMTAKAADALTGAVVNNSGVIEAKTLANKGGRILLLSDMEHGETVVSGTLDASAPNGGDGGFVETSGGKVRIGTGSVVTTKAAQGKNGTWLIDPDGFTIAASGGDMDGATLSANLDNGDVSIASTDGSGSDGNINVNDAVNWTANTLTLTATNDVNINAVMTAGASDDTGNPGTYAALDLEPGSGKVNVGFNPDGTFKGRVDFFQADGVTPRSGTGFLTINGNGYTVINDLGGEGSTTGTDLQGINGDTAGYYALGSNIDATPAAGWNGGEGFMPLGTYGAFTGTLDGLGHTIDNLTVNRPGSNNQGLFSYGANSVIRNVGLTNANITGNWNVGGLMGYGYYNSLSNVYATGTVTGYGNVGGLVGYGYYSPISNSHATGTVTGYGNVGGLMGYNNSGNITDSYATNSVTGNINIGGLVGYGYSYGYGYGRITNSYASGEVRTTGDNGSNIGGLVGYLYGSGDTITNSYATGAVTAGNYSSNIGGLVGYNDGGSVADSHATGNVTAGTYSDSVGGLLGNNANSAITNSYATGTVLADANASQNVGGLVGNNNSNSSIDNSYATGPVTGNSYVGGLVGYDSGNTISNSHAIGAVSGANNAGGLVGYGNVSTITNSYATGVVTADVSNGQNIGGLVGYGYNIAISDSHATGAVTGNRNVGGLMGYGRSGYGSASTISNTYATGAVTAGTYSSSVGGLVGKSYSYGYGNTITNSYATSAVTAGAYSSSVGGLVGENYNTAVTGSHATGAVVGSGNYVGGLVGSNGNSPITDSYASGAVSGSTYVGGLVGQNSNAAITNSHATGTVAGSGDRVGGLVGENYMSDITSSYATGATVQGSNYVGGLVGINVNSAINNSFATGAVTGSGNNVGGLVGTMYGWYGTGSITNAYATGTVTGSSYVGGLVGSAYAGGYGAANTITNTYAAGAVNGSSYAGGLVGGSSGTSSVTGSFWDKTVNSDPVVDNGFGIGKTTIELKTLTTFTDAGWDIDASGGTGKVWRIYDGNTMPLLRSFLTPLTISATDAGKTYDGQVYSSSTAYTTTPAGADTSQIFGSVSSSGINVGTYAISAGNLYSSQAGYDISSVDGTLTVTPAALTVTASDASKTYGQTPTLTGFTSTGLQNGETIGSVTLVSAGTAATAGVTGSPYTITASNANGGTFSAGNYTITYNNGALTVTPAPLSVTANDDAKNYSGIPYAGGNGVTYSGFVNGEGSSVLGGTLNYGGTSQGAINAGSYTITPNGLTGGNYLITYSNGALTITGEAPTGGGATGGATTGGTTIARFEEPIQPSPPSPEIADPLRQLGPSTVPPPSVINSQPSASGLDTMGGPVVNVVGRPTTQGAGVINVTVPSRLARPGAGFSFLLPEEVSNAATAGAVTEKVSLSDGSPLPVWLRYYPDSKRFVASDVPPGSLPITVVVSVGELRWMVKITAQQDR